MLLSYWQHSFVDYVEFMKEWYIVSILSETKIKRTDNCIYIVYDLWYDRATKPTRKNPNQEKTNSMERFCDRNL